MLKTLDIVLIAVMISAAAWTYKIKHEAETLETAVTKLERRIALERETISLLEADWSLLDQPNRLQRIANAFQDELQLQPMRPDQIVRPDELPRRPVNLVPETGGNLGGYADSSETVVR
ncbi:hypothetical protein VQ042_15195 [Aurantimonas sp. A2-1-M11]|uniref:cell division protein FtsL n=1 Tax=Aurantimonas sp. A2-1-M11 TaxID=3113712 RepID=UPI002F93CBB3